MIKLGGHISISAETVSSRRRRPEPGRENPLVEGGERLNDWVFFRWPPGANPTASQAAR